MEKFSSVKQMKNTISLILMLFFSMVGYTHAEQETEKATFAGGCFWCMEPPFDKLPGVLETISGYTGGDSENPSYEQVSSGTSGHYEALQIIYNPKQISYQQLLQVFWQNVDPTDNKGQFCDKGPQYRSAIFYYDEQQQQLAIASKEQLENNKPFAGQIKTMIKPAAPFYKAENYHQNYYRKNPLSYKFYRYSCGRDRRLKELWGNTK